MASNVMSFIDNNTTMSQERKSASVAMQQDVENAVIYTCEHNELPPYALNNVFIYTRDTGEIYAGMGKGISLLNMSDITIVDNFDYLPAEGINNKLYISRSDNAFAYYDNKSGEYTYLTLNEVSSTVISKGGILEFNRPNDFPINGESGKLYLTQDNRLYRWDALNKKYALVSDQGAFNNILKVINSLGDYEKILNAIGDLQKFKADKTELSNYRSKTNKIALTDLDDDVINAIGASSGSGGSSSGSYDDSAIKQSIADLFYNKADTDDLKKYRLVATSIEEKDLSANLKNKINATYDDTSVKNDIENLKSSKLNITDANLAYRSKTDSITLNDLDSDLKDAIGSIGNSSYDDSDIKNAIQNLQNDLGNKADTSALSNYRSKNDSIDTGDLTQDLQDLLKNISTPSVFDDSALIAEDKRLEEDKLDKADFNAYTSAMQTTLGNLRSNDVKISESDLDSALIAKIDSSGGGTTSTSYDDSALKAEDKRLEDAKLDKTDFNTYSTQNDASVQAAANAAAAAQSTADDNKTDLIALDTKVDSINTSLSNTISGMSQSIAALETDIASANQNISDMDKDISDISSTLSTVTSDLSTVSSDISSLNSSLSAANKTISDLTTQLAEAIKRIEALENAGGDNTDTPTDPDTPVTPDTPSTLQPFKYTFALNGPGESSIALNTLPEYDETNPISLNDFYGITDEDETYNPELQKVVVTFLGYGSAANDDLVITNPKNVVMPVSIQGTTVEPDKYVDYDSDTTILSFGCGSLSKRIYSISTIGYTDDETTTE